MKSNTSTSMFTTNRLEALADGVFAIAMTLLVLELSIPVIEDVSLNAKLGAALFDLLPKILVYLLSFVVLGIMWANHHFMFHCITRSNGKLIWINIIFLMFVALIPFSASLLGEYSNTQLAVTIYGINGLLCIAMCLVTWIYISGGHNLADVAIDAVIVIRRKIMYMVGCSFFIIGIGISYVSPVTSLCIYGLAALLSVIISWTDSHGYLSIVFARILRKRKHVQQ
jgi:uncharacterized membrane protein